MIRNIYFIAFMLFVTEIVIYSHFMGQMTINQSFLWKLSSLELQIRLVKIDHVSSVPFRSVE